jgi:hypothetical protein
VIVIIQEYGRKTVLVWDINRDHELANYTLEVEFIIKFDNNNKPFIIREDGKVLFLMKHCLMDSFDYEKSDVLIEVDEEIKYKENFTES